MRRVNESLREVLSEALGDLKDPRIGFVTVTGVRASPDLRQATVYVSVLGSARKRRETLAGLESSRAVLQSRLNRELRLKRTPQLTFEYDQTPEEGVRFRVLGRLCAEAMDHAIRAIRPGFTEHQIAAQLALEGRTRGIHTGVRMRPWSNSQGARTPRLTLGLFLCHGRA